MKRSDIRESDFDKLFFIDNPAHGRLLPIYPVYSPEHNGKYDDDLENPEWYNWKANSNDRIYRDRGVLGEGLYFAKEPAGNLDVTIKAVDFLVQTSLHPEIQEKVRSIVQDFMNIAAAFSKIGFYQEVRNDTDLDVRRLTITEVEYIFTVCRSVYDLFQEVFRCVWERIELHESSGNQLPENFTKMALESNEPVPSEKLEDIYGLSPELANVYESYAAIFNDIRSFRNEVIHDGVGIELILSTEKGFGVSIDQPPFCDLDAWEDDQIESHAIVYSTIRSDVSVADVAPIWPPISKAILSTISLMNDFVDRLEAEFNLPPYLAPDYEVYIRGHYLKNLTKISNLMQEDPWGQSIGATMAKHLPSKDQ
ncbi:hypothetical protein [Natrinema versiforme]|uniref:Uncharacterized protein n=1 Tax=Natrinema versiforme TaxID=88724 RepID=A0A4V1FY82_9EURY|nr:hypothetical protein [Natrinema versiforme]QCS41233.1 hypothetical protein FEJ81_02285 [Natrinema versiforme]